MNHSEKSAYPRSDIVVLTNRDSKDKVWITEVDEYYERFPDRFPEERIPPFPLLDIFENLRNLSSLLQDKTTLFGVNLVTELGHPAKKIEIFVLIIYSKISDLLN